MKRSNPKSNHQGHEAHEGHEHGSHEHAGHENAGHEHAGHDHMAQAEPQCSCDHNPGGPCHCPPNEFKCDRKHHNEGRTQHSHESLTPDEAMLRDGETAFAHVGHAGHEGHADHSDHAGHAGHHDHSGHQDHAGHGGHDHAGHHDHSHHDPAQFKRWFWFALVLTVPTILYSSHIQHILGYSMPPFPGSSLLPAIFGTILFFSGGLVFLRGGIAELKQRAPGMMALISLALVVAFAYSLLITVFEQLGIPWEGMDFWWELAALVTIMLLGHWIEMSSIMGAQNALGELAKLLPDTAERITEDGSEIVPVSELRLGDQLLVRPGAAIPADGVITKGRSTVNEALLTGESRPVEKQQGDSVIAGSINFESGSARKGALTITVTALGDGTVMAGIMRLVAEAQQSKSKTQLLADKAAGWLFWLALGAAIITAIAWFAIGTESTDFVLERIVTVLVIACPHALGLAIPLVTAISTAKAARLGLLIRDRMAFEQARKVDVVLFDKTGTLTTGERAVVAVRIAQGSPVTDEAELVALAAAVERESEHSLAAAIVAKAREIKRNRLEAKEFQVLTGLGVSGVVRGKELLVGGPALLNGRGIRIHPQDLLAADAANQAGRTVVFVVQAGKLLGQIEIGDQVRENAASAIASLRSAGIRVSMVTGDAVGVAQATARELGIEAREVFAEVLPARKHEIVKQLQAAGARVAFVGDGVNDAPALVQAEVGIAIGAGTDVAIESADMVLMSNDPAVVVQAIGLSHDTVRKMVQNLWWASGYNLLAIPLAAGVLWPIGIVLSPALGAVLMSASTVVVALNAQLLRRS